MLGSLILYLKGMRTMMFQLSGFYCRGLGVIKALENRLIEFTGLGDSSGPSDSDQRPRVATGFSRS